MTEYCIADIKKWVEQCLCWDNCQIEIEGTTEKGEGYIGDFVFLTATKNGKVQNENEDSLDLVVKMCKSNRELGKKFPMMHELCKREVIFYSKIIPAFNDFLEFKNSLERFESVPKCYSAFQDDKNKVIIMENIKKLGYELHPTELPLNPQHIRMGLKNLAKLHSFSLAIKDQQNDIFQNMAQDYYLHLQQDTSFKEMFDKNSLKVLNVLKSIGRKDLSTKYEKVWARNVYDLFRNILEDAPEEKAVVHADCHNLNFLFKYKDTSKQNPCGMILVDFQTSILHSPILDVSSFLYINLSENDVDQYDKYIDFYHQELSSFLCTLGSDPNIVFSKNTLTEHCRKYSSYGFHFASIFMEYLFINKEDAPSLNSSDDGDVHKEFVDVNVTSNTRYVKRLEAVVNHYFQYNTE